MCPILQKAILGILLLAFAGILSAQKIELKKHVEAISPRRHPYTHLLEKAHTPSPDAKSSNFDRLLVILVDFQEESPDDPNTTGNGKFILEPDPAYQSTIGSPPHDRDYFLKNLEAARYYYLAASAGSYDLKYEVWPPTGAYTLPQTMGWYNPPNAGSDLFVARMEQYFKDAFEIADSQSPELNFGGFGHYMIIHAGSDWQHDLNGDTPSDIPSFFIKVEKGKEAVVDGGATLIRHACNVPSTISQDFYTQESGAYVFHGGYGALNSVLVHEFGHSLGFKDLYNVYSWQPMVGVFDIMDSGGSGVLLDQMDDGSLVLLEGGLPGLPGAWSRELVFGQDLQDAGLLVDLDEETLFSQIWLAASSHKQQGPQTHPQILRFRLSPTEYILVENRSVDPDGDGATAVKASEDHRVILYPTALADPTDTPTYEYDYLLPSFQKPDGSSVGGGILVWRINEDQIYQQGFIGADGSFVSNFENNSVNTLYHKRGVEIIEADNLPDIGNDHSWFWTGTEYDYFHGKKPVLDGNGSFQGWSLEAWTPRFNSETKPPLRDTKGMGSLIWLDEIGDPGALMKVKPMAGFFQASHNLETAEPAILIGPSINSSFTSLNIPVIGENSITLFSYLQGWEDLMGPFAWEAGQISQPIMVGNQDSDSYQELLVVRENTLEIVEFSGDSLQSKFINFPAIITTAPLYWQDQVYVGTAEGLGMVANNVGQEYVNLGKVECLGTFDNELLALGQDMLFFLEPQTLTTMQELELPEAFGDYEPVTYIDPDTNLRMIFLMANSGNIYKYQDEALHKIFSNTSGAKPTQMGFTKLETEAGSIRPVIFWGEGNRVHAMKHDGTLIQDFPYNAFPLEFSPGEHVYSMIFESQMRMYLPLPGRGHVAFVPDEGILWQCSFPSNSNLDSGMEVFHSSAAISVEDLTWYYVDSSGRARLHSYNHHSDDFQFIWKGFRNMDVGSFGGSFQDDNHPQAPEFTAFVFPNPVKENSFRVRVENFNQDLKLRIFDIKGSMIQSQDIPANGMLRRDISLDGSKLASGVYILVLQKGMEVRRIKFAVEK